LTAAFLLSRQGGSGGFGWLCGASASNGLCYPGREHRNPDHRDAKKHGFPLSASAGTSLREWELNTKKAQLFLG